MEEKNEPFFYTISLANAHLIIIRLGLAFGQVSGSYAINFNGNS